MSSSSIVDTATVTAAQTLSSEVDLANRVIVGCEFPALATNTTINLQVTNVSGGTYRNLLLSDLSGDWQIASATENLFVFVPDLAPFRFVKVLLGASQVADYVVNFIGRD